MSQRDEQEAERAQIRRELDDAVTNLRKQVTKAINNAIKNDPVLAVEVQISTARNAGFYRTVNVVYKEGRTAEGDRHRNYVVVLNFKTGRYRGNPPTVQVSMAGYANPVGHAVYKRRKDGTYNMDALVARVVQMCHVRIAERDDARESRIIREDGLKRINKLLPWKFNGEQKAVFGNWGGDRIIVRANYDLELSVSIDLRGPMTADEVQSLLDLVNTIRANHGDPPLE